MESKDFANSAPMMFPEMASMVKGEPCPKHACGFWGMPLGKLPKLKELSDDKFECCLWHESKKKCNRNPRFQSDPKAQDCFDPASDEPPEQIRRRTLRRSHIRAEDLSIETLCKRMNIQSNLLDLQSKDKEKVTSALKTLSMVMRHTDRKDARYALVGYYKSEVQTIDEIIDFFKSTEMAGSIDLSMMMLKDLVTFKDLGSRRLFTHDLLHHLNYFTKRIDDDGKSEIRTLIENSAWGDKLKRKFLGSLFYGEFERGDDWTFPDSLDYGR
ncbi:MAG: hypothetical protein HYX90_08020 [Chloroflexi bacterium]|nr:hypothetical protein [Chloroflexota bacterium]